MRVDPDRAQTMLRDANPIPDPHRYRELRDQVPESERPGSTTRLRAERSPRRRRWAAAFAAGAAVVVFTVLGPLANRFGGSAEAPFDNPVEAVPAVVAALDAADPEAQAKVLQSRASVDLFGHTRTLDSHFLQRDLGFGAAIGRRHLVEDCWQVDQQGYCRLLYQDDLIARAGLAPFPEEWSVTLGADGFVATVRATGLDSPQLELVREWFTDFNQWLCRNEPEAARMALWDPLLVRPEYDEPDCTSTEWQWIGDRGDPEEARRLHDLYLADRSR